MYGTAGSDPNIETLYRSECLMGGFSDLPT